MGIIAGNLLCDVCKIHHTLVNDNFAVVSDNSELFHQIICSPKTAVVPRQGAVGAAGPW